MTPHEIIRKELALARYAKGEFKSGTPHNWWEGYYAACMTIKDQFESDDRKSI